MAWDRGGAEDDGHHAADASAARTGEDVGAKRPLEELGPGDGAPWRPRGDGTGPGATGQRTVGASPGGDTTEG
jgi:hypothetical protein